MEGTPSVARLDGQVIKTSTVAGAAYVKKVTHPPTVMPQDYMGTPDMSAPNVVLLETKAESNIPPIIVKGSNLTTTITTNPSSMLFVVPSSPYAACYCFMQTAPNTWVQPVSTVNTPGTNPLIQQVAVPAVLESGYNFNNFRNDASVYRMVYKSTTFYLNATDFNNQGTITTAKFKPNLIKTNNASGYLATLNGADKLSFVNALGPLGKAWRFASLNQDDFTVVGKPDYNDIRINPQFDGAIQIWEVPAAAGASIMGVPFSGSMTALTNILPNTASDVLTMSPKGCTRPAKDGAFVVQQQAGPISEWVNVNDFTSVQTVRPVGTVISMIRTQIAGAYAFAPLFSVDPIGVGSTSASAGDCPWSNLDWSITLLEGLTIPSTTGTTLSSVPYVTIKSFSGCELQASSNGSLLPFQRLLPLPDPDALMMATGIFHARPDSLPASANDLGSIAATAIKFLPTAVGWLKDLFGSKPKQDEAIAQAKKFVKPAQSKPDKKVQKELVALRKQVSNLAVTKKNTTLPTYTNGTAKQVAATNPRPKVAFKQRSRSRSAPAATVRTQRSRSRARK